MSEAGIHHVTAFAGPAARNRKFYTATLGLRLVKTTVNFDDPSTYHLYYGDDLGRPGTLLTFFPINHAAAGRLGIGETSEIAFRVPKASLAYWTNRFAEHGIRYEPLVKSFGESVLRFQDPDGMRLALVGADGRLAGHAWDGSDVPAEHAIHGFHGITLLLRDIERTATILTDVLGFARADRDETSTRFVGTADTGSFVTLKGVGDFLRGRQGAGSVHHVAFRAADDAAQEAMTAKLGTDHGLAVTEQRDRCYFRSVYFREPGGVLFEIATDGPGFAIDETVETLGETLKLPGFLEPHRAQIEQALPKVA